MFSWGGGGLSGGRVFRVEKGDLDAHVGTEIRRNRVEGDFDGLTDTQSAGITLVHIHPDLQFLGVVERGDFAFRMGINGVTDVSEPFEKHSIGGCSNLSLLNLSVEGLNAGTDFRSFRPGIGSM